MGDKKKIKKPICLIIFGIFLLSSIFLIGDINQIFALPSKTTIFVIGLNGGTDNRGQLLAVDPTTGFRNEISDLGNSSQGPLGFRPTGVALEPSGDFLVLDQVGTNNRGVVFRVDENTGVRTILSDYGNLTQGPLGFQPSGIVVNPLNDIFALSLGSGPGNSGLLFKIDPVSGFRTQISAFGDPSQGPLGLFPVGLDFSPTDELIVVDTIGGTGFSGALYSINPVSGFRTLITDFGNPLQGPTGLSPQDVDVDPNGKIVVIDSRAGTSGVGTLFEVNPNTGFRNIVSDFGIPAQGPIGHDPLGVKFGINNEVLVADQLSGTSHRGEIFSVDTSNGLRSIVSDLGNPTQGILGATPVGLDVFIVSNNPPDCSNAIPSTTNSIPSFDSDGVIASSSSTVITNIEVPPFHKTVEIFLSGLTDIDGDPITLTIDGITQDEPTSGSGKGDKSPDGFGVGTDTAEVRAERLGTGDGRVYEISFTADDGNGGECSDSVFVGVPHDNKKDPVDSGQNFDSSLP